MDRIRSAYEMALERLKERREVLQAEIDRMEHITSGKIMAATFLRESNYQLLLEIEKTPPEIRGPVLEGIQETFMNNIFLPVDQSAKDLSKKALEGIALTKKDKQALSEVYGNLEHLYHYYEQSCSQAYEQLKESFSARKGPNARNMDRMSRSRAGADPGKQPAFHEEWSKMQALINSKYEAVLMEQKGKLRLIN